MSMRGRLSAYERWTWTRCRDRILSLKGRHGYGERLWVLGYELHDDGRLLDPILGAVVFDPAIAGPATTIPSRYDAIPEIFCILDRLACADEFTLTGELVSLSETSKVIREELTADDCTALLRYGDLDLKAFRTDDAPFIGGRIPAGDLGLEVWPLPGIPIRITLWAGEEDLPSGGVLCFDQSALHCLPGLLTELAWLTVWRLRNILDPTLRWGYHQLASRCCRQGRLQATSP